MEPKSVWEDLVGSPAEAENLRIRSYLMREVGRVVKRWGITQKEASEKLGITQPRLNDLLQGKIDKFSLDALVLLLKPADLELVVTITGEN